MLTHYRDAGKDKPEAGSGLGTPSGKGSLTSGVDD